MKGLASIALAAAHIDEIEARGGTNQEEERREPSSSSDCGISSSSMHPFTGMTPLVNPTCFDHNSRTYSIVSTDSDAVIPGIDVHHPAPAARLSSLSVTTQQNEVITSATATTTTATATTTATPTTAATNTTNDNREEGKTKQESSESGGESTTEELKFSLVGNRQPYVPGPNEVITNVNENDVLCGRGGETNHHPGNVQYRNLVKKHQIEYLAAKRRDKPLIARLIVDTVRSRTPPGRFLKKDNATGTWRDVGSNKAREKTSQALREGAPEIRSSFSAEDTATTTHYRRRSDTTTEQHGVKRRKVFLSSRRLEPSVVVVTPYNSSSSSSSSMLVEEEEQGGLSAPLPPLQQLLSTTTTTHHHHHHCHDDGNDVAAVSADDDEIASDSSEGETSPGNQQRGPRLRRLKERIMLDPTWNSQQQRQYQHAAS